MIQVTHLISGLRFGGAESMLGRLLENRDRTRFDQLVISLEGSGPMERVYRDTGVDVVPLGDQSIIRRPLRLIRLLQSRRGGILMTWLYHADLTGVVFGRIARVNRLVWNLRRETSPNDSLKLRAQVRALAAMSRIPDVIISNSNRGISTHAEAGYAPRTWKRIPNGFDVERFRPAPDRIMELRRSFGIPTDALVVGMAARFHPIKNHRGFLEMARRVKDECADVHFVLVGAGSAHDNELLRSWIDELELRTRVTLLGPVERMELVYRTLDIYVCASKAEGFPNAVAEAMASGVACVATNVGDVRELVDDTGIIVPLDHPDALSSAVGNVLADEELRRKLGQRARKRVVTEFSIERIRKRFETVYETLTLDTQG